MTRGMINISSERMGKILEDFSGIEGKVPLALSRALNRATSSARSEAVRQVRSNYTVKAGKIRETIKTTRAKPNKLKSKITSTGSAVRLKNFKVSPTRPSPRRQSPIRVEVRRGSKKTIPGAFVARVNNGNVGVFARTSAARLPIKQLFGPPVPFMMNNDDVVRAVQERAEEQLDNRIGHELNRVLGVK